VSTQPFVPEGFAVPAALVTDDFRLEPLGPQHNEADYAAWTGSMDHIRATPGFAGETWPHEMSLQDNLGDLEGHAKDFAERRGFTYTVLDSGSTEVIGCVYIYPRRGQKDSGQESGGQGSGQKDSGQESGGQSSGGRGGRPAKVQSWVRADRAALDSAVHDAVLAWLERDWPFGEIDYAPRA
jgi:hypothetical protein